jgi:hypothetical protein
VERDRLAVPAPAVAEQQARRKGESLRPAGIGPDRLGHLPHLEQVSFEVDLATQIGLCQPEMAAAASAA